MSKIDRSLIYTEYDISYTNWYIKNLKVGNISRNKKKYKLLRIFQKVGTLTPLCSEEVYQDVEKMLIPREKTTIFILNNCRIFNSD